MKLTCKFTIILLFLNIASFGPLLNASETSTDAANPTVGGTTGLITTPSAFTGWNNSDFAMDFGYHFIFLKDNHSHIPMINIYFLKMVELGAAYDVQSSDGDDYVIHAKVNFFNDGSSYIAFGGNFQHLKYEEGGDDNFFGQIYFAVSYRAKFFTMTADTTLVVGKTFNEGTQNADFDFSMGLDLELFPSFFKKYIHWVNEYSNYTYTMDPASITPHSRGAYNTGIRILVLKNLEKFKLNLSFIGTDLFDEHDRSFCMNIVFGFAAI